MTGFARIDGAYEEVRWSWEIKSVNARGLEMRFRLPSGLDRLEPALRSAAKARLARGGVVVSLVRPDDSGDTDIRLNDEALNNIISLINEVQKRIECSPPHAESILTMRGVLQGADAFSADDDGLLSAIEANFISALDALVAARVGEGEAIVKVLAAQIDQIEKLSAAAAENGAAAPAAIRARIESQLASLLPDAAVSEDRIAQEASLLALKADVREEIDRLAAHVEAARALLAKGGPVGRQLDFLTQEFNREANTLCSKASDMSLKQIGLELKGVIDQMREQVQNIE